MNKGVYGVRTGFESDTTGIALSRIRHVDESDERL